MDQSKASEAFFAAITIGIIGTGIMAGARFAFLDNLIAFWVYKRIRNVRQDNSLRFGLLSFAKNPEKRCTEGILIFLKQYLNNTQTRKLYHRDSQIKVESTGEVFT
jgi:hypothetical protein